MFGTNVLSSPLEGDGQWLEVQDILSTIQGEGPLAGFPAIFLRLAGCNLRCFFCDTDFESRRKTTSLGEVRAKIGMLARRDKVSRTDVVVVTGGEPLLQNVLPLCEDLCAQGFHVQFETAGTVWVDGLESFDSRLLSIVCSPKTPKVHPMIADYCRHWKYLIRAGAVSQLDGLPIMSTQIQGKEAMLFRPPRKSDTVWLQPCEEYSVAYKQVKLHPDYVVDLNNSPLADQEVTSAVRDEEATQRNIRLCAELAMKYNYRVSLQLHKLLHLP
jgi:organic radical activating enzyme